MSSEFWVCGEMDKVFIGTNKISGPSIPGVCMHCATHAQEYKIRNMLHYQEEAEIQAISTK